MDFQNKSVLVCGMAKSGISAALLLKELGANVTLQDKKEKKELPNAAQLEEKGILLYTGKNPDEIVAKQDLIVVSPGIPCDLPFFQIAKENNVPVWSEVELSFRLTPCPVAAITGTNGKTTTTTLAGEILQCVYPHTQVVGNIGVPYSSVVKDLSKDDWVVAEISSFQLETCHSFAPQISAVLNITPDHLNRHKTLENYIAVKESIFKNQTPEQITILNYEDTICRAMAEKTKGKVFFFSSQRELDKGIYLKNGQIFVKWERWNQKIVSVEELQILGVHNYENVMAAAAIGICAQVPVEKIAEVLRQFRGVEHRIEYVATVKGVDYYNDSKGTNPDAAIRAVNAMVKPTILIGGGYDKGSSYEQWVETFPGKVKKLVLIGDTADKIEACAKKSGFLDILRAKTFDEAIEDCYNIAKEGDCVLLSPACASWDMFRSYEERGDLFKKKVHQLLKESAK